MRWTFLALVLATASSWDNIPQLLTLLAVSKALCVSPHTVRSWVKKGKLRPLRVCRRLLFHPSEIERFLAQAGYVLDGNQQTNQKGSLAANEQAPDKQTKDNENNISFSA